MADAPTLFALLETAAGYALFEVVQFEEIASLLEGAADAVTDLTRFGRAVKLKAFQPFESAVEALENCNAISEHAMTDALRTFLEMNLPKARKRKGGGGGGGGGGDKFALGVVDAGLATAIGDGIPGLPCRSDDTVREVLRGCRLHLTKFVRGLGGGAENQAQLGLGHSYSRGKVKFNPARSDNMIIQSIALLDQMDKDLNTFAMRVREWYSWHFPELKDLVKDNYMFARCAAYVQDKATLCRRRPRSESGEGADEAEGGGADDGGSPVAADAAARGDDKLPGLVEIIGDEETARAVVAAARTSMGMDCSAVDMVNIVNFTRRMVKLAEFRGQLAGYLHDKMGAVAPNLSALIGDTVAARLISKAGSLTNLAKAPASTVQILGAEKALFRALKTKGNTPKYGLIYHSSFIGRADAKNKGRISRYLANKCSIATRIDSFADDPNAAYGEKLREQVEERLRFYETGAAPRKNIDAMREVARQLGAGEGEGEGMDADGEPESGGKKKKKKRKRTDEDEGMEDAAAVEAAAEEEELKTPSKKTKKEKRDKSSKKKKKREAEEEPEPQVPEEPVSPKKDKSSKKKKKREAEAKAEAEEPQEAEKAEEPVSPKKDKSAGKKKKKKKKGEAEEAEPEPEPRDAEEEPAGSGKDESAKKKKKKKKKRKSEEGGMAPPSPAEDEREAAAAAAAETPKSGKKKKKKRRKSEEGGATPSAAAEAEAAAAVAETPKSETPKSEAPKSEAPKSETPKSETPKSETPKSETPESEKRDKKKKKKKRRKSKE